MQKCNVTARDVLSAVRKGRTFTNYSYVLMRHDQARDTFLIQPYLNGIQGGGRELSVYQARKLVNDWLDSDWMLSL